MKKTFLVMLLVLITNVIFGQKKEYQLSSHILDVSKGAPASGVSIKLEKYNENTKIWSFVDEKITDENGRISDFFRF